MTCCKPCRLSRTQKHITEPLTPILTLGKRYNVHPQCQKTRPCPVHTRDKGSLDPADRRRGHERGGATCGPTWLRKGPSKSSKCFDLMRRVLEEKHTETATSHPTHHQRARKLRGNVTKWERPSCSLVSSSRCKKSTTPATRTSLKRKK